MSTTTDQPGTTGGTGITSKDVVHWTDRDSSV